MKKLIVMRSFMALSQLKLNKFTVKLLLFTAIILASISIMVLLFLFLPLPSAIQNKSGNISRCLYSGGIAYKVSYSCADCGYGLFKSNGEVICSSSTWGTVQSEDCSALQLCLMVREKLDRVSSTTSQNLVSTSSQDVVGSPTKIRLMNLDMSLEGVDYIQKSYQFFNTYKKTYNIEDPATELKLVTEHSDSLGMTHLQFQQYVQEIPVYAATVALHFRKDGLLSSVNGTYVSNLSTISTSSAITSEEAFRAAQKNLGLETNVQFTGEQLIIYDDAMFNDEPSDAKLVWKFVASLGKFSSYTYYVDAQTGDVIKHHSNVQT